MKITSTTDNGNNRNMLLNLAHHFSITLKLLFHSEIPLWIKSVPFIIYGIYFFTPINWALIGPIDDGAVILFSYFVLTSMHIEF